VGGRRSIDLSLEVIQSYDAVFVSTDHDNVDYALIADHARLIVDTRNVFARCGVYSEGIVKA
jgi:UDP-N-acetyl-D-glucosamine dehydrogenase